MFAGLLLLIVSLRASLSIAFQGNECDSSDDRQESCTLLQVRQVRSQAEEVAEVSAPVDLGNGTSVEVDGPIDDGNSTNNGSLVVITTTIDPTDEEAVKRAQYQALKKKYPNDPDFLVWAKHALACCHAVNNGDSIEHALNDSDHMDWGDGDDEGVDLVSVRIADADRICLCSKDELEVLAAGMIVRAEAVDNEEEVALLASAWSAKIEQETNKQRQEDVIASEMADVHEHVLGDLGSREESVESTIAESVADTFAEDADGNDEAGDPKNPFEHRRRYMVRPNPHAWDKLHEGFGDWMNHMLACCHAMGENGTFNLTTYEEIRGRPFNGTPPNAAGDGPIEDPSKIVTLTSREEREQEGLCSAAFCNRFLQAVNGAVADMLLNNVPWIDIRAHGPASWTQLSPASDPEDRLADVMDASGASSETPSWEDYAPPAPRENTTSGNTSNDTTSHDTKGGNSPDPMPNASAESDSTVRITTSAPLQSTTMTMASVTQTGSGTMDQPTENETVVELNDTEASNETQENITEADDNITVSANGTLEINDTITPTNQTVEISEADNNITIGANGTLEINDTITPTNQTVEISEVNNTDVEQLNNTDSENSTLSGTNDTADNIVSEDNLDEVHNMSSSDNETEPEVPAVNQSAEASVTEGATGNATAVSTTSSAASMRNGTDEETNGTASEISTSTAEETEGETTQSSTAATTASPTTSGAQVTATASQTSLRPTTGAVETTIGEAAS